MYPFLAMGYISKYRQNDKHISEYLILLVEVHNLLTLVYGLKNELNSHPDDTQTKATLKAAAKELKQANAKLLDYQHEFIHLSELIENSRLVPQYLKIDSGMHTGYFNVIDLKLSALRRQNLILNERLNEIAETKN
ncbi:MAG: hypothetical protein L3J56_06695 [Bacteroidales bacterium]|nr:hypothetical protein [Bacteroidales bacterium]